MAILIHKLKTLNTKKALTAVILAGFAAFLISSPFAAAQGPQFNTFPICYTPTTNCDLPLLDGRNFSRGEGWSVSQIDHDNGVNASTGEIVELSVYYHNGAADAPENVALNAFVRAFASPGLGGAASTHTISAEVGAQNAASVSSASKGGNINIYIQNQQSLSLSLVPGSVFLYPNQGTSPTPSRVQLPDTIFTSGVNIGNVNGCFQYHGFVNFRVQVSQAPAGQLTVQKHVKNITQGIPFNDNEVSANPGDLVEYQILVSANTNSIQNVSVKDALDPKLTVSGSVTVDGSAIGNAAFFGSGVSIGTVNPGVSRDIRFQATVAQASQFTVGTHVLPNTATAFTNPQSDSDSANVKVVIQPQVITCTYTWDSPTVSSTDLRGLRRVGDQARVREQVTGLQPNQSFNLVNRHVSGLPTFRSTVTANSSGNYDVYDTTIVPSGYTTGDYNSYIETNLNSGVFVATCLGFRIEAPTVQQIDLDKTVKNDATGGGFADSVQQASPGQSLTFRLVISPVSSNTALQNVIVRDTLPSKLSFVSGTFNLNGSNQSEGAFFGQSGLNAGTLQPGGQITITFQTDVASASNFTTGQCEVLTNSATVTSGSLTDTDTATVQVCVQAPTKQPGAPGPRPL